MQIIKNVDNRHARVPIFTGEEVIQLKFGDMIIAVASMTVIAVLIFFPVSLALTPTLGFYAGFELSAVVAFLLSPIIIGYLFTQKIWEENRTRTIAKITVLFTVFVMVVLIIENATAGDWTPMTKESYLNANPTATTPSTFDWYYIERLAIVQEDFEVIVLLLALTFIGLYIGSIIKKPTKI